MSYKRKYSKKELEDAKFRKAVMKAAAKDTHQKIQRLEREIAKMKEDWHRLSAESKTPIRRIVKDERKRKGTNNRRD